MPLLREIRARSPETPVYLSTSTVAGRRIAEKGAVASGANGFFYAPIDFAFAVRRVLRTIRPSLVVVLETEIWPNLFSQVKLAGAGLAVVNGRISDRTWPKYRLLRFLFSPIVRLPDRIFVQSSSDAERFQKLGALSNRVGVEANLKYDAAAHPARLELPTFGAEQVWIAASTVGRNERGSLRRHSIVEEKLVLNAFRELASSRKKLLLIVAPRQPARFDEAFRLLRKSGFPVLRRTALNKNSAAQLPLPGILLLDTLGELARIYSMADVVFVGGSLAPRGGHNILEPAFAGAPIVVGPHMQNFEAITRDFLEAEALYQTPDANALASTVGRLLDHPNEASSLGARGQALAQSRTGAANRMAGELLQLQSTFSFRIARPWFLRLLPRSLALLWETGGKLKRRRSVRMAKGRPSLGPPVISVGGITLGGSGKTPFTNYLATRLRRQGHHPAILTRGYRRRSPDEHLVIAPGTSMPAFFTGDEAQIYLRSGSAAVGIGSDRYDAGRVLLSHYPETGILLLDDGFQHAKMPRDLDIVIIDGLDPFGGGQVFPAGRLREPISALARADVFVVTRCRSSDHLAGLTARLHETNPGAPVFASQMEIPGWRCVGTGQRMQVPAGTQVAAFCGLGNPDNFFRTLESLGLKLVARTVFADHHSYKPVELRRLAQSAVRQGAELLVTTEKDRVNFPQNAAAALGTMEAAWLEIDLALPDEANFLRVIESKLLNARARAAKQAAG